MSVPSIVKFVGSDCGKDSTVRAQGLIEIIETGQKANYLFVGDHIMRAHGRKILPRIGHDTNKAAEHKPGVSCETGQALPLPQRAGGRKIDRCCHSGSTACDVVLQQTVKALITLIKVRAGGDK